MHAVKIPVDPAQPLEVVTVEHGYRHLARAIGGPCEYIEVFRCPLTPEHNLVGVCDDLGQFNDQPDNIRAWPLYPVPGYTLKGTVLVMAEGTTPDGLDFVELDDPGVALGLVAELLEGTA